MHDIYAHIGRTFGVAPALLVILQGSTALPSSPALVPTATRPLAFTVVVRRSTAQRWPALGQQLQVLSTLPTTLGLSTLPPEVVTILESFLCPTVHHWLWLAKDVWVDQQGRRYSERPSNMRVYVVHRCRP